LLTNYKPSLNKNENQGIFINTLNSIFHKVCTKYCKNVYILPSKYVMTFTDGSWLFPNKWETTLGYIYNFYANRYSIVLRSVLKDINKEYRQRFKYSIVLNNINVECKLGKFYQTVNGYSEYEIRLELSKGILPTEELLENWLVTSNNNIKKYYNKLKF